MVRSLKASSFVWFFRHQDDVSESFSIVVCSCFFGEVAKSVANTVLFVFRFWLNVGVRCEVFVWKASTTRVFLYWWCLKSNVTTRATKNNIGIVIAITVGIVIAFVIFRTSNQYHAKQHQHHQHHQHPPNPPAPPMHRAERETVHVSRTRMDVISHPCTEVKYIACARSRGSAQCCPDGKLRKTPRKPMRNAPISPMRKTQNNKRNTTQKPHSRGRHHPPHPHPLPTNVEWCPERGRSNSKV